MSQMKWCWFWQGNRRWLIRWGVVGKMTNHEWLIKWTNDDTSRWREPGEIPKAMDRGNDINGKRTPMDVLLVTWFPIHWRRTSFVLILFTTSVQAFHTYLCNIIQTEPDIMFKQTWTNKFRIGKSTRGWEVKREVRGDFFFTTAVLSFFVTVLLLLFLLS